MVGVLPPMAQPGDHRPSRLKPKPLYPNIMSMFVEPQYRGTSVASALVREVIGWAKERGFRGRIIRHASDQGHPVQARLGFQPGRGIHLEFPELPAPQRC